jgi:hypothetical protein
MAEMRCFWGQVCLIVAALLPAKGAEPAAVSYTELKTRDGKVFHDCKVVRTEPDALVVEHRGGVARLSLFDLPEAVQQAHGFDPFAAMEFYKARADWQQDLKWKLFWEKQAHEADQAKAADLEAMLRTAEAEWVPVEATVIQRLGDGAVLARCRRVVFERTRAKSTLGFDIEGPPRRKLVDFGDGAIVLRMVAPVEIGADWKGYVNPVSDGAHAFTYRGVPQSASAHRAAPLAR